MQMIQPDDHRLVLQPDRSRVVPGFVLLVLGIALQAPLFFHLTAGGVGRLPAVLLATGLGALSIFGGVLALLNSGYRIELDRKDRVVRVKNRSGEQEIPWTAYDRVAVEEHCNHGLDGFSAVTQVRLAGAGESLVLETRECSTSWLERHGLKPLAPRAAERVTDWMGLPDEDWTVRPPSEPLLARLPEPNGELPTCPPDCRIRCEADSGVMLLDAPRDTVRFDGRHLELRHGFYPKGWFQREEVEQETARLAIIPVTEILDLQMELDGHLESRLAIRTRDHLMYAFERARPEDIRYARDLLEQAIAAAAQSTEGDEETGDSHPAGSGSAEDEAA